MTKEVAFMQTAQNQKCQQRKMPQRYGVVDQRLVSEGYLKRLSGDAMRLYVFLCVTANREGRSWYSDAKLVQQVRLGDLGVARRELVGLGLIGYHAPVYTLLDVVQEAVCKREMARPAAAKAEVQPAGRQEVSDVIAAIRQGLSGGNG